MVWKSRSMGGWFGAVIATFSNTTGVYQSHHNSQSKLKKGLLSTVMLMKKPFFNFVFCVIGITPYGTLISPDIQDLRSSMQWRDLNDLLLLLDPAP
jgi:hypothetical protein